jgi:hypothetical protein
MSIFLVKAAQLSRRTLEWMVMHLLVLLSIVDHYNCVAWDTRKHIVGVLPWLCRRHQLLRQ